ncbi:helitron_like_N domain-containing protein [Trichonephila clavipes]|nr:helitron_like_N domain-containing protein [Trichonephila clavipes]
MKSIKLRASGGGQVRHPFNPPLVLEGTRQILHKYKTKGSHDRSRNKQEPLLTIYGRHVREDRERERLRYNQQKLHAEEYIRLRDASVSNADTAGIGNCIILPSAYIGSPHHMQYIQDAMTFCALWAGGIIGPYFFKNDEGHNVTVNGDRYRAMITNFFIPELNNHDVQELWFQQDGATCHTARATVDLLKDTFGDRLISRFGPVNWPPRSCDLTPLDYFL